MAIRAGGRAERREVAGNGPPTPPAEPTLTDPAAPATKIVEVPPPRSGGLDGADGAVLTEEIHAAVAELRGTALRESGGLYGRPVAVPGWRLWAARVVSVLAVAGGLWYLLWRLSTLHGTGALGVAFFVAEWLNYFGLIMAAVLFWRPRWRIGPPAEPTGTLDVFIPVCGEPVEMVEATLRAALAIQYPHQTYLLNDGRIAGKANWAAIEDLAARYGVPCFTRTDGARGKGANLNHALTLTDGDIVATIDADHVAIPELAHQTLGYFADPKLGFVSTPQQFEGDPQDILNNREILYFRFMAAAKDADNAIQTYGNGVYRRAALDSIEGFSEWVPLCEDLHSCFRMQALGWRGVYHPSAVTTGLAPVTASSLAKQRLTWATDSLQMFFRDNPMLKKGLSFKQRLHYFQTTSHYLITCTQLLFMLGPVLWLLWRIPVMSPRSTGAYLLHLGVYLGLIGLLLMLYGGIRGGIRVIQATLFLAPVHAVALIRALARVRRASVTEKRRPSRFSLLVVPQAALLGLNLAALGVALWAPVPARGLVGAWAAYMVVTLAGFLSMSSTKPWRAAAARIGLRTLAVGTAAVVLFVPPLGLAHRAHRVLVPPAHGAYLGFFDPDLLTAGNAVDGWKQARGIPAGIVHWYQQWGGGEPSFRTDWVQNIADQGAAPLITWEPWAGPEGRAGSAPSLRAIAAGDRDAYIRSWAHDAAAYRDPILLRPLPLANGTYFPWSMGAKGNTAATYVRAWRHIHNVFAEEGAGNVSFVWAIDSFANPGSSRKLTSLYPGDRFVDWISLTGFNWGTSVTWSRWQTFDDIFGSTYTAVSEYGKPVMIAEVGTTAAGGDPAAWIRDAFREIPPRMPLVKAVLWYDAPLQPGVDLRLTGVAADAFRSAVKGSAYWDQPLTTVKVGARRRGGS